jgi:glycosyltransferase involved in cell wall biosynthesis
LTECDKDLYTALYAPPDKVVRIPNIVRTPGPTGAVRRKEILSMGRYSDEKGFDLLLEAWSLAACRLPDWSLCIVGEGKLHNQLMRQASKLGIEQSVTFAPFSNDPFTLFSECGIFVLSSRFEGLGLVLIEAMTCGAACISFDCPNGPREIIRNGIDGLLVPAERVQALADGLVRLGVDPELREKLGEAAQSVSTFYSEERVTASWHEVFYGLTPDSLRAPSAWLGKRFRLFP